jgi:hypothetical protein
MSTSIAWPKGKRFAFTVFDDTDSATVENVGAVYAFLADCGLRTTKSCWVLRGDASRGKYPGQTLDDDVHRRWLVDLQAQGFEIGWHGATWHGSLRAQTAKALERFSDVFGHDPKAAANHTGMEDAIYWGSARLGGWRRFVYNLLTRYRNSAAYRGHIETDPYFWGDLCRQKIKYVRNFVFRDIDTLKACPWMPYHDPQRPFVNGWFASSDGHNVQQFNECIAEAAQDRLEEEGGACIVYAHFAAGFAADGRVEPRFKTLVERLSKKNGWFVPAGTLLEHLQAGHGPHVITEKERGHLERKWLFEKLFIGTN